MIELIWLVDWIAVCHVFRDFLTFGGIPLIEFEVEWINYYVIQLWIRFATVFDIFKRFSRDSFDWVASLIHYFIHFSINNWITLRFRAIFPYFQTFLTVFKDFWAISSRFFHISRQFCQFFLRIFKSFRYFKSFPTISMDSFPIISDFSIF